MGKGIRKDEEKEILGFLKKVGTNIRTVREQKGLTLEQVEAAGYPSWRHLQKVESGQPFTVTTLYRIAKALKVKPNELLY
jgi:transcriptional regulator with XRE-family HTH domain